MFEKLIIKSHKGPYTVYFDDNALERLNNNVPNETHFIIDSRIADLYQEKMVAILGAKSALLIDATEVNKSLDQFPSYVEHLVEHQARRDHQLIAIGGGIIQDITCFLATTFLRGVTWSFYPTTLLAQADSCIGSKSSINTKNAKNILGTFTPPNQIHLSSNFLSTLELKDVRSGIGEMLKVHAISGPEHFDDIAAKYDSMLTDAKALLHFIRRSLDIKKKYVEEDEFDQGVRRIFNYGHSFGHAIEAATNFAIPHGIAVTIGMDMANWLSWQIGVGAEHHYLRMHHVLRKNAQGFENITIPPSVFMKSISKDKKNIGADLTLILPGMDGMVFGDRYSNNERFSGLCAEYLTKRIWQSL